jgi:repressor LexA
MENNQDPKPKSGKRKDGVVDLRQLDMWGEPIQTGPGTPIAQTLKNSPKKVELPQEFQGEKNVKKTSAGNRPAIKVTVSAPSKALPNSNDRSLPALTRRQHELLDYLRRRAQRNSPPPSLTEICADLGLVSRGSLHKQVVALVRAKLVEPMDGKQRGVRLAVAGNDAEGAVPLLGAIAAGQPIEALTRDESITLPAWMRSSAGVYALRVKGDSMRDAGILDGDVVVIEPRSHARNGETVVALIDGEQATLKRIEQRPDQTVLHAENSEFEPQRYQPDRVQIQGVVVAQLRRYR